MSVIPTFPVPGVAYSVENESQFRREVERIVQELAEGAGSGGGFSGGEACRLERSSNFAVNTGVLTQVEWNSEIYDDDGLHDPTTNPERITAVAAGVHILSCGIKLSTASVAAGDILYLDIYKNGTSDSQGRAVMQFEVTDASLPDIYLALTVQDEAAIGDYYTVGVFHNTTNNENIEAASGRSFFAAVRVT